MPARLATRHRCNCRCRPVTPRAVSGRPSWRRRTICLQRCRAFAIHGHCACRASGGGACGAAPTMPAARGRGATAPLTLYAIEDLAVTGGEMNVSLRLQPGMTISGRAVIEAGGTPGHARRRFGIRSHATARRSRAGRAVGARQCRWRIRVRRRPARPLSSDAGGHNSLRHEIGDITRRGCARRLLDVRAGEDVTDLVVTCRRVPPNSPGRLKPRPAPLRLTTTSSRLRRTASSGHRNRAASARPARKRRPFFDQRTARGRLPAGGPD